MSINNIKFERWTDADYANDVCDRVSVSGCVFKLSQGAIT